MKWTKYLVLLSVVVLCSCGHKENNDNNTIVENEQTTAVTTIVTTTETTASTSLTTTAETTSATTTTAEITETVTTEIIETTADVTENNEEYNQIFSAIESLCYQVWEGYGYDKNPYTISYETGAVTYENEIDYFIKNVSALEKTNLGAITDADDLYEKSKEVFIWKLGQDFIERVEADYVMKGGEKVAIIERTTPIYVAEYNETADLWYISPCMPSGELEDGTVVATLYEWHAFLMVRGNDGEIIGCRF